MISTENWSLPDYDLALHAERRHNHALVIPVINEGNRIRDQLLRVLQAQLPVDVVIADGGSTDGSLESSFVASVGVRAVLTKRGPGKLSAQLRMAYAWCLSEGYSGIVTIDGNGKDGVEAVAAMVTHLNQGAEYVQGSRYLPGGAAENTPLERSFANRCIHAPLLSLAGRHWYTDTTNGFRAYSARYLLDPRVQPFREVFQRYELLFYLTVRAGQIGMKVADVPVRRSYPKDAPTPTKIQGLNSKLEVLRQTISAAVGSYSPEAIQPKKKGWSWPILVALLTILPILISSIVTPSFSPDSWAYYELSKTVFSDFYRFTHFRTYWDHSQYSSSFPPLYPLLVSVFDLTTGAGARSGFYLSFASFILFLLLSEQIGRRAFGVAWIGLGTGLLQLLGPEMIIDELTAGRTIPLQLVIFAVIILLLTRTRETSNVNPFFIGLVSGMAVLNRFDAVLLPILITIAVWQISRQWGKALYCALGAGLAISPWIIYSTLHFNKFFVTDNANTAKAIDPKAFVTDWWPTPQPTLYDDLGAWLSKISDNFLGLAKSLLKAGLNNMGLVLFLTLIFVFCIQILVRNGHAQRKLNTAYQERFNVVRLFGIIILSLLTPQMLAGYYDPRYFAPLYWVFSLAMCGWIVNLSQTHQQRQIISLIVFSMMMLPVFYFSANHFTRQSVLAKFNRAAWSNFENSTDISKVIDCVGSGSTDRILVLGNNNFASRIGALSGISTMMEPRNMSEGRLDEKASQEFLKIWKVNYVLVANPSRLDFAASKLNLERVSNCDVVIFKAPAH